MEPTTALQTLEQCPWHGWAPPALVFCEEALCSWIKTPSNAWSNLAFVFVGIWILFKERKNMGGLLFGYGPIVILIGLLSFFYHASGSRLGEIGDLSSMFLMGVFLAVTNSERMGWITVRQTKVLFWTLNIFFTTLLFWITDLGAPLFFVQCMFALYLELKLRKQGKGADTYKYFIAAFFVWLAAQTIWALDLFRIVCNPQNHILQGHAVWHILMAGLAGLIYKHYTRIPEFRNSN